MNAFTSNACLVLHTEDPDWAPDDIDRITRPLQSLGLIAETLPGDEHRYLAGEHFLELIAFMGCSPSIRLSPGQAAERFSYIHFSPVSDTLRALTGKHTHAPHCPHCNKPVKDWRRHLSCSALPCTGCGQTSAPWLYNWRKSAGFGRFFIEITEIYPKEAIPQSALLAALEQLSNGAWKYFYHYR